MVTYYRGRAALITHDFFQRGSPGAERFRLGELRDIEVTASRAGRSATSALALTNVLVIAAMSSWPLIEDTPTWVGFALLLAAAPGAWCGACLWRRRTVWELRAVYRGHPVVLLRTPDERTFGQVRRALVRALEAPRPRPRPAKTPRRASTN
jgi:hypothetical protein